MKTTSFILTDVSKQIYVENCTITPAMLKTTGNWSVTKTRLKGGLSDGVDIIEVNNGRFSFTVVPTRGMNLWHGSCDGCFVGWNSPVKQIVNPAFVNLDENGGLGFLKGMNECLVHCGLNSTGVPGVDNGAHLTLHGKIANLPAKYVEVQIVEGDAVEIKIIGIIDESRIFSQQMSLKSCYSTKVGEAKVSLHDEVTNFGDLPAEMQMLYHCNFGEPFLEKGAKALIPTKKVVPRDDFAATCVKKWDVYDGYTPGYTEQCMFHEVYADKNGDSLAMLKNKAGDKAAIVRFNKKQLPVFTQWKRPAGKNEGYVTGLEPAINFPNFRAFERNHGRIVNLQPGETYAMDVAIEICATKPQVAKAEAEVAAIMKGKKTTIAPKPTSDWVE